MNINNPKFGITPPLSMKESTEESLELSKKLDKYLKDADFFESEDDAQTRERVLGKLDFLVKKFVQEMAPECENKSYGGKIFTFGSYRLGVHDKGADIDALCVVPRHVSRKDFFTRFYDDLSKDPNVTDLSKVEEAYVPIIKLKYHNIPIDLPFARLNLSVVKDNISLLNDSILKSMDEKSVISLNASRVTDAMLNLVPNTEVFHSALRAVKFWAKRRHIYGNIYGYFGGVAYSICVARVCQMYPNLCSYDILLKFFEVFSTWKWPNPVQISPNVDLNYNFKIWDPKINPSDKYHRMPVITPVYPSMCSTYNVTQSTFNAINSEFARGYEILKSSFDLSKLFEYSDYFRRYKIFVEINITSNDSERFKMWEGYVESKIRILSTKLENLDNISNAIPFPKAFKMKSNSSPEVIVKNDHSDENIGHENNTNNSKDENESPSNNDKLNKIFSNSINNLDESKIIYSCWFFIAIDFSLIKSSSKKIYVDEPIKDFLDFVNSWDFKTADMKIEINPKKKKDVQDFIRKFYLDDN